VTFALYPARMNQHAKYLGEGHFIQKLLSGDTYTHSEPTALPGPLIGGRHSNNHVRIFLSRRQVITSEAMRVAIKVEARALCVYKHFSERTQRIYVCNY